MISVSSKFSVIYRVCEDFLLNNIYLYEYNSRKCDSRHVLENPQTPVFSLIKGEYIHYIMMCTHIN